MTTAIIVLSIGCVGFGALAFLLLYANTRLRGHIDVLDQRNSNIEDVLNTHIRHVSERFGITLCHTNRYAERQYQDWKDLKYKDGEKNGN